LSVKLRVFNGFRSLIGFDLRKELSITDQVQDRPTDPAKVWNATRSPLCAPTRSTEAQTTPGVSGDAERLIAYFNTVHDTLNWRLCEHTIFELAVLQHSVLLPVLAQL
jgi:hypothetical protein